MEKYLYDWDEVELSIARPNGFVVTEEIEGEGCDKWRGETSGDDAVFLLTKVKRDLLSVVRELNSRYKLSFLYLGIKDTNAVTSQLLYVKGKKIEDLPKFYEAEDGSYSIRFLGFKKGKLNHTGNIFSITASTKAVEEIRKRIERIREDPFLPNFVGYQRFGSRRPVSHIIGKFLLKREWDKAFQWIVGYPFLSESENIRKIRSMFHESVDFELSNEKKFPFSSFYENNLVRNYYKTKSFYEALKRSSLPIDIYVDAFQSYVFNRYLSRVLHDIKNKDYIIKMPLYFSGCDDICKELYEEEGVDRGMLTGVFKTKLRELQRRAFMKVKLLSFSEKEGSFSLTFSLPRGSYATIFLRELTHANPLMIT